MIENVEQLEEALSEPTAQVVRVLGDLPGDIALLGVGGKMGPTMARMARRASELAGVDRRVIGVSRFGDDATRRKLHDWGIETITCDLLDEDQVGRLPRVDNVVFMTGMKFGAGGQAALTWAMNCYAPLLACRHFRDSRIVAFSTGNVYGMVPVDSGGSREDDPLAPAGEYAMSALARERMYQYSSDRWRIPMAVLRLNYATELRYGVLVDLAMQVRRREPVDVSMGHVNVLWLADANAMSLCAFEHAEIGCRAINVAGAEILNVRDVCERFGRLMDVPVRFTHQESDSAFLNDGRAGYPLLGTPRVDAESMIRWTADWVDNGRENLGKPTRFQVRDGQF